MMEELKPCTCGGEAVLISENYGGNAWYYGVRCTKCQKLQTMIDDRDKAIDAWNRRYLEKYIKLNKLWYPYDLQNLEG